MPPVLLKEYSQELVVSFQQLCGENRTCVADVDIEMEFLYSNL